MIGRDVALLARTAVHLRPGQIAQRARLRTQRAALHRFPPAARWLLDGPDPMTAVGWPAGFSPLDGRLGRDRPGLPDLREGRLELLGMSRTLIRPAHRGPAADGMGGFPDAGPAPERRAQTAWMPADWEQADAPALWRFHLHYWDWSWALAAEPNRAGARAWFAALWRSWQAATVAGGGVAWSPYPAALRAWSFCGVHRDLIAGSEIEDCFIASLSAHTGFLRRHLETDVGGNHLIKNLKALAGLAVFFADEGLLERALARLTGQLAVQILPDGGHYERAPAYHVQVLADLIDVAGLIRAAGREPGPQLTLAIRRMRRWLSCVLTPDGQVPLLNDGYPVGTGLIAILQPGTLPDDPLLVLPDTGLVRASAGGWDLLADVGAPCPDELPAHAHADTLSCLLNVDGVPLLVDTGTSTYAPGPVRDYERSTAAHNTIEVDGTDSTEVWGAFRAARRARVSEVSARADAGVLTVEAVHDGFRRRPGRPAHRRRWSLSKTGLRVDDLIGGSGDHAMTVRWHFAPGSGVRLTAGGAVLSTPVGEFQVAVSASRPVTLATGIAPVATGFSRTVDAPVLTCHIQAALPVRIITVWRCALNAQLSAAGEPAFAPEGTT